MIYPIILSIVAVIVIIVMLVYIVPMYSDMFVDMDAELPAITRAVVGLSNFMTRYWYIILIGIFAIVMGLRPMEALNREITSIPISFFGYRLSES